MIYATDSAEFILKVARLSGG